MATDPNAGLRAPPNWAACAVAESFGCLLERAAGEGGRFAAGEDPSAHGGEHRKAHDNDNEVGHGNPAERAQVVAVPDHESDVGTGRAQE
jgi:hypothetical protein